MNYFNCGSNIYKNLKELSSIIESRAKVLSRNQKLIVCALIKESPNVNQPVFGLFLTGLGFSAMPELNTPALNAVCEICALGNSGNFQLEDLQSKISLLRVLGQLEDMHVAINFITENSIFLCSIAVEIR